MNTRPTRREPRYYETPERLSDIKITRVYDVECGECGVIDAPPQHATALESRRRHWELRHARPEASDG